MIAPRQADRYYQIVIAFGGLAFLIYGLFINAQFDAKSGIFLLLTILAGLLIQYPFKLLQDEISLLPAVGLGGALIIGPVSAAWAISCGILCGYTYRWLIHEKRTWRRFLKPISWIKIGYKSGIIIIPLFLSFAIFGYSNKLLMNIWHAGLGMSAVFIVLHATLFGGFFIFKLRSKPYPRLRAELIAFITIEFLPIPFVLLIVGMYPVNNTNALALFAGIPIIVAYLIYQMNAIKIEHERRSRELSTLNHISSTIRSTLNLDELLPVIQEQVMQLLEVNNFYVALYDSEADELWYPFAIKLGKIRNWPRRAISDRLTDRVIKEEQAILLTPQTKPTLAPIGLPPSEDTPIAWLGVPLISSERTIGCLAVFSLEPGNIFTKADLDVLTILSGQASVAIENALLYQQVQHRAHQMETLNQLTAAMTASLDLSEVLTQVCNFVARVGGSEQSAIFLLDQETNTVSLAHTRGLDDDFRQRNASFSISNSRRAGCLRTGKPMVIPDIKNSSMGVDLIHHFQADHIQALADFPLVTPDGQIGFLSVYFNETHDFSHEEVSVLQTFASQAALAVANARLHARTDAALAKRVNQLTTLEAVGRELSAESYSDRLFDLILQYALEITNSCCGAVLIQESDSQSMKVKAANGYRIPNDTFPIHRGITGRVARSFTTANIGDVTKDPDYLDLRDGDTRSQLCIPIIHEKRMLGIISLESLEYFAYSESEESFVTQLANHAAIDIINAELYRETQRRLGEQSTLYQASTKLVGAVSPNQVIQTISQAIDAVIKPLGISIYFWSSETQKYALVGEPSKYGHIEIVPSAELTRLLLNNSNLSAIKSDHPLLGSFTAGCDNCQVFIFPLDINQQQPGIIVIYLVQHRNISKNEAELIKTLLAQGTIALHNARNFVEAKNGRDRLAAILNSIEEGILMIDIEGHVLLANEPIRVLTGLSVEEILETPLFELPDQILKTLGYTQSEITSIISALNRTQLPVSPKTNFRIKHPQRTNIIERVTTPVWGHDGTIIGLMIVLRDITEEREIEETREAITETIVHDVRSPMSAIVGSLELLSDTLADADNPIIAQSLLVAQRSAHRVLSLTEALLDIARLQSGRMEIDFENIDLPTLVSELMVEYTVLANDNNVIIRNDIPNQLPAIRADRDKLIRVITNLVDNAIKFSPQGGYIVISAEVESSQFLNIKVSDSGPGVPQDYRERIFERFVQVPGQNIRRRGTGLGLTFCQLTVEAHGGSIWVDSNPDGGSVFTFSMPIA
jgi:PAS domain S-box-containing protein